jgi:hypothetical protein
LRVLSGELQKIEEGAPKKKYRVTFQPLVGNGDSKDYVIEADSEEIAREVALEKLILEESDGMLAECPGQIATAEEIK